MSKNFLETNNLPTVSDILRRGDVMLSLGLVSILLLLLMPMPRWLLDVSLALSISFSILIFLTTIFIQRPLDFSSFPTILLVATMLRLSLNVASTRLILTYGHEGLDAAGSVIKAFGNFLMGGNFLIGIIIFIILIIVNFIVITKGSGRIAEVSARFTLDSLPGKQMAIDAELSSGLIDESTARTRRKELEIESNFFGAMDGAAKFVRGDAVAGLLITGINIVAGIVIGVNHGMTFSQASHAYTFLTVGDGLVSQVPALMVSTASGMLVSKVGSEGSADKALMQQLTAHPMALGLCSFLMMGLGFLPGTPKFPFFFLAFITGAGAWYYTLKEEEDKRRLEEQPETEEEKELSESAKLHAALRIDPIRLELGYAALALTNKKTGGEDVANQIRVLRQQIAAEMGIILPSVRIQDNLELDSRSYSVRIKDVEVGQGSVRPGLHLVMNPKGEDIELEGEKTTDPTFGIPALWIREEFKQDGEEKGYTVVDATTVLMTHFSELIRENISDLLSYQDTQALLDEVKKEHEKLIKDLVPDPLSVGTLHKVLQNLLKERVSIRDLPGILEAISEVAGKTSHSGQLTEHVRMRLARQITSDFLKPDGTLPVIHLSTEWQQKFLDALVREGDTVQVALAPTDLQKFVEAIKEKFDYAGGEGEIPVLLTSGTIRSVVRSIIERFRPAIPVLSQGEIHSKVRIHTIGEVTYVV